MGVETKEELTGAMEGSEVGPTSEDDTEDMDANECYSIKRQYKVMVVQLLDKEGAPILDIDHEGMYKKGNPLLEKVRRVPTVVLKVLDKEGTPIVDKKDLSILKYYRAPIQDNGNVKVTDKNVISEQDKSELKPYVKKDFFPIQSKESTEFLTSQLSSKQVNNMCFFSPF